MSQDEEDPLAVRLAVARRVAERLAREHPTVAAVLAMGSVGRGRPSAASDLDLAVISLDDADDGRFESLREGPVLVDCEWMSRARALATARADAGHTKALRDAARLGLARPVLDPDDLASELARLARAARPSTDELIDKLATALSALSALRADPPPPAPRAFELQRSALDAVAVAELLLTPGRFQKPKWTLLDLHAAGHDALASALAAAYGAADDRGAAEDAVRATRALLDALAARLALPSYEAILALGHTVDLADWSYAARTHEDASSLLADGRPRDAAYVARFAARVGVALFGRRSGAEDALSAVLADGALCALRAGAFPFEAGRDGPDERAALEAIDLALSCKERCEALGVPAAPVGPC